MDGMRRAGGIALATLLITGLGACGDDSDGGSEGAAAACARFSSAWAAASGAIGATIGGASLEEIEEGAGYFDDAAQDLPEGLRDDLDVFAEAYSDFVQALVEADIDLSDPASIDEAKLAEIDSLSNAFTDPDVARAVGNLDTYVDSNCEG